jgi:hypothetical protein
MSLLGGCAMGSSEARVGTCPPVVEYSRAEQARAAGEVEALPEGAVIERMLSDYAVMREQARACRPIASLDRLDAAAFLEHPT